MPRSAPRPELLSVSFCADGRRILGSGYGVVGLWDASTAGIITSLTQLGTGTPVVIQNNCVSQSSSTCK